MPIYVHRNSQQLGPYTAAEVKSQLANGALSVHDHVWWQGEKGWVPLGESSLMTGGFQEVPGPAPIKRVPQSDPGVIRALAIGAVAANLACAVGSVAAIIMGHKALSAMKKDPSLKGRGMAIAGLIIGYIMTLLYAAIFACYFLLAPEAGQEDLPRMEVPLPNPPTNSVPPVPSHPSIATPPAPVPAKIPSDPAAIPRAATNSPNPSVPSAPTSTNNPTSSMPATNAPDSSTNAGPMNP